MNIKEKLLNSLERLLGKRDYIFLSGQNGYDGSARVLYEYLQQHATKRYKYIWMNLPAEHVKLCRGKDTICFPDSDKSGYWLRKWHLWQRRYYRLTAKYCFIENAVIKNLDHVPVRVFITHGLPTYKDVPQFNINVLQYVNYVLAPSESQVEWWHDSYEPYLKGKQVFVCGLPRVDLINKPLSFAPYFGENRKVVIWMPTFRKSDIMTRNGLRCDGTMDYLYGLPLINSNDDLQHLNEACRKHGVVLLIKPHPLSAKQGITEINYSNIAVWTNEWLAEQGIENIYQFFADSVAMISDYSSSSFDYMYADKPIAYIVDDLEDYKATRGLVYDDVFSYMPGHKIKTLDDFALFIADMAQGKDPYHDERQALHAWAHKYQDFDNAKRMATIFGLI